MSPLSPLRTLVLAALLAAAGRAAAADDAYAPPALENARAALLAAVGRAAASAPVTVDLDLFGHVDRYEITAVDGERLALRQGGSTLSWATARLAPAQLMTIGEASAKALGKDALAVADYALAADLRQRAEAVLDQLATRLPDQRAAAGLRLAWLHGQAPKLASDKPAADKPVTEASTVEPPGTTPPAPAEGEEAAAETPRKLDPEAALRVVMDRTPAGINRRLGPDAAYYRKLDAKKGVKPTPFPEIWMPPKHKQGNRAWEIGGPWSQAAGDFSSAQGQVLYAGSGLGVDRVTIIEMTNNCFTESPEPPWWGGFRPEPNSSEWAGAAGGGPVGVARGMHTWSNCGVIVFANGLVCSAGTCTAVGTNPTLRLPEGKLPTALSVTGRNEFALITVVDIKAKPRKAQLAVIALTGCKPGFAHEWQAPHPGLPSVAMIAGMKLLGFVDLPGMAVPTAVSGVGEFGGERLADPKSGNIGSFRDYDMSTEGARNYFRGYASGAGWAVVAATYEDKVAFVDLQPLFQYYRGMYCTTAENYRKTCDQGPAPKQWPYTFEAEPGQQPVVVKTMRVPEPTAVLAGFGTKDRARAYVASRDGKVAVFKVGGLATDAPAAADEIGQVETVQVGRNPVSLAYQRYSSDEVIAVSRGDRELAWIKTAGSGSTVVRRLRDSRLTDPVQCEVVETHGIETALLTVCDFAGQKIVNYRYGELRFATNGGAKFGMGEKGGDPFECGGLLEFPGPPFAVCAANVN
jgi:hypothetical protein